MTVDVKACDACGKEWRPKDRGSWRLRFNIWNANKVDPDVDLVDLCEYCVKDVNKFLKKLVTKKLQKV